MNKTEGIEWAIGQALLDEPLTLDDIERRLAAYRMLCDGRMGAVGFYRWCTEHDQEAREDYAQYQYGH